MLNLKKYVFSITAAILLSMAVLAYAEEGGSGHYMPGSMSSFADGVASDPTFLARINYIHYNGSTDFDRSIPYAGLTTLGADATSNVWGLTLFWAPEWGQINDTWNYAMSTTIPWVSMDVAANVSSSAVDTGVRRSDTEQGLGDIVLQPLMLNYKASNDLNVNFRVSLYTPTGTYEVGRLANTGKNFWTVEPTAAIIYLGQKNGIEGSLFFGLDFNTENKDTSYKSGIQVHLDGTLAQHFPLLSGLAGAGVTGFWYQQISDDSGDGASLGAFRARAHGIGPVLSYGHAVAGKTITAELKWLHEFDNQNRLEGDTVWFKLLAKF